MTNTHDFVHLEPTDGKVVIYCAKCLVAYTLNNGTWEAIAPPTPIPDCVPEDVSSLSSNFGFTQTTT